MAISNVVAKYLIKKLGAFSYRRGWLKMDCPLCGGSYKFGYKSSWDIAHCFKCEYKSDGVELVRRLEGLTSRGDVYTFLQSQDFSSIRIRKTIEVKIEKAESILPPGFRLLSRGTGSVRDKVLSYFSKERKLSKETLFKVKVGYATINSNLYGVFPVITKGRVYYYQGRLINGVGPKFINPPEEKVLVNKSEILYNERVLNHRSKVYIVESIINVLTLDLLAVAGLGKTFNKNLISKLIRSKVEVFVIALDPDAWGWALSLGLKLINHKKIKLLQFPGGLDVNNVGKQFVEDLEKKAPLETYSSLIIKKKENEYSKV